MLARANRLLRGDDFRKVMRSGKRHSTPHLVGYQLLESGSPTRFGFVVSKACGKAVKRNQIKRRLRSLAREKMTQIQPGSQIVLRALPGSAEQDFSSISSEFSEVLGLR
ncbi:MAG: ribonuclease P protein component [Actinomycetota bacterium]